jgi:methylated-DNA-[protein]-cysteine S-methyltransferase
MTSQLLLHRFETGTPLDPLWFVTRDEVLIALDFDAVEDRLQRLLKRRLGREIGLTPASAGHPVATALRAYIGGDFGALDTVAVDGGGTAFQQRVWTALRSIPPGETSSYGALAARLGSPNGARAVGLANGLNPVSLFIPCHRLIGSTGGLTGYGGGIARKRWLLEHERAAAGTA